MHFAIKCIYLWQFTLHCYTLLEEPLVWQWVFALVYEKHGLCNLIALHEPSICCSQTRPFPKAQIGGDGACGQLCTFSFFPSVLHSSVGDGCPSVLHSSVSDDWVLATDDDSLAVDQTDKYLITAHAVVKKAFVIYWSVVLDASHIWCGNSYHPHCQIQKEKRVFTLPVYSVSGHSRF